MIPQEIKDIAQRVNPARHSLLDFAATVNRGYVSSPFHTLVAGALDSFVKAAEAGQKRKLMIFCPPQRGKSTLSSQAMPAYFLGRNPEKRIILTSYAQDLANKFSRKTRDIVGSTVYGFIFPRCELRGDVKSVENWQTTRGGEFRAAGAGAGITGMGAHILVTDDPFKDAEEAESETIREKRYDWYLSTARSRLAPGGSEVMVLTRWHMDDLAGRLLQQEKDWQVIKIPLFATDTPDPLGRGLGEHLPDGRYSKDEQEALRSGLQSTPRGRYFFNALYQQDPQPSESMPFPTVARCEYTLDHPICLGLTIYVVVDIAKSEGQGDATAILVGGISGTGDRYRLYAEELHEAPAKRNARIIEVMRRVKAHGCTTCYVEGDADALAGIREAVKLTADNFSFAVEQLKHKGRNKANRIIETDAYIHSIKVGPEAELYAKRLTEWSAVSGTPDDLPDAGAYLCEIEKYNREQKDKLKEYIPPVGTLQHEVYQYQKQLRKQGARLR